MVFIEREIAACVFLFILTQMHWTGASGMAYEIVTRFNMPTKCYLHSPCILVPAYSMLQVVKLVCFLMR